MTIREALEKRIPRLRQQQWANPKAYLRLPLLEKGYGPWAELYDRDSQLRLGLPVGSQKIPIFETLACDGFEEYTGEPDPAEHGQ